MVAKLGADYGGGDAGTGAVVSDTIHSASFPWRIAFDAEKQAYTIMAVKGRPYASCGPNAVYLTWGEDGQVTWTHGGDLVPKVPARALWLFERVDSA